MIQICACIGENILRHYPKTTLTEYIPLYLCQTTTDNQVHIFNISLFISIISIIPLL